MLTWNYTFQSIHSPNCVHIQRILSPNGPNQCHASSHQSLKLISFIFAIEYVTRCLLDKESLSQSVNIHPLLTKFTVIVERRLHHGSPLCTMVLPSAPWFSPRQARGPPMKGMKVFLTIPLVPVKIMEDDNWQF